jgi:DNA-binding NarL/FixJ family response regulator
VKKLLIVDDHRMFADGIRFLMEHRTDYEVIGVLHRGQDTLPFLARQAVDIILLDIDLPDLSGFVLARDIRLAHPAVGILALSMLSDMQSIDRMMEAGATGYCIKSAGLDELLLAIRLVDEGNRYLPGEYFRQRNAQQESISRHALTGRETEVIRQIVAGASTRQIADQLYLSVRTVETHRKNIYRKLGVHTNVELVQYARKHQLL